MCLICGSDDVRLASRDKVQLQEINFMFLFMSYFHSVKTRHLYLDIFFLWLCRNPPMEVDIHFLIFFYFAHGYQML